MILRGVSAELLVVVLLKTDKNSRNESENIPEAAAQQTF